MWKKRSASLDNGRKSRSSIIDGPSRRQGSGDRQDRKSIRTARSSLLDPVQRAPDLRADKQKNINELIAFLHKWNIEAPERFSVKLLQCPSSKLFLEIFKFLLDIIMPGYQLSNKYEEDIPFIVKSVGYPYPITKSSILSIAPHSWPTLCHALVSLTRSINDMPTAALPDDQYAEFALHAMANPDQNEKLQEEMSAKILDSSNGQIRNLQKQLNSHINELASREKLVDDCNEEIEKLTEQNAEVKSKIEKMDQYKLESTKYLKPKEEQLLHLDTKLKTLTNFHDELRATQDVLEAEYSLRNEELPIEERNKMVEQQATFIRKRKDLAADIEGVQGIICDTEIKQCQLKNEVASWCRKFNILVDTHMDISVAENLRIECTASCQEKLDEIIQSYLEKLREAMRNDEGLREKVELRERVGTRLKIEKGVLDDLQQELKVMQKADSSFLNRLSNAVQEASAKHDELNERVTKLVMDKEESENNVKQEQELITNMEKDLASFQEKCEREEKERVEKLKIAFEQYKDDAQQQKETLARQNRQLSLMLESLECLKAEWESTVSTAKLIDKFRKLH